MNEMLNLLAEREGATRTFFESLGYRVTWDANTRTGEDWWEVMKGDQLVAQVDTLATVDEIKRDFSCWARGEEPPQDGSRNYVVSGPDTPELRELFEKVVRLSQLGGHVEGQPQGHEGHVGDSDANGGEHEAH